MDMFKSMWNNLDPNKKRWVSIIFAIVGISSVVSIFSGDPQKSDDKNSRQENIKNVLTVQDTRAVGMDSLSAQMKLVSRENLDLKREIERMKEELAITKKNSGNGADYRRETERLRQDMDNVTTQMLDLAEQLKNKKSSEGVSSDTENEPSDTGSVNTVGTGATTDTGMPNSKDPAAYFQDAPLPSSKGRPNSESSGDNKGAKNAMRIVSYSQKTSKENDASENQNSADDESVYLPSGSILTGVLINGMDAPTSQGARRDPFPSTLRIQKEAILPNRFRADVRECFLILSGYGDLSSERAYLRGESFSCVREDGGVIEATLASYAVGEDGKAGIRGRLVSKQGQIIAKSLMAGFMAGASEAFDVNPVPTINTNNTSGRVEYQSVMSEGMLQGAAVQGASKALDRVAQFYIQMAEGIFPVIEVDAGRQIDIIVTKGTKLQIRSTSGTTIASANN